VPRPIREEWLSGHHTPGYIFTHRMPCIRLATTMDNIKSIVVMTYNFPSVIKELVLPDNDNAVHQVLCLLHSGASPCPSTPAYCRLTLFQVFSEKLLDNWTHVGSPNAPVMHVSDVVNHTLWHMRTCHPHPARMVHLSMTTRGMPKITHPQDIEQCLECLIAKMRKAARGHDNGFEATAVGHGLATDVGFMFQTLKNKNSDTRLMGLNG
jgi:hypothetical protein